MVGAISAMHMLSFNFTFVSKIVWTEELSLSSATLKISFEPNGYIVPTGANVLGDFYEKV